MLAAIVTILIMNRMQFLGVVGSSTPVCFAALYSWVMNLEIRLLAAPAREKVNSFT